MFCIPTPELPVSDALFALHFAPSSSELCFYMEEDPANPRRGSAAEYAVDARKITMIFRLTIGHSHCTAGESAFKRLTQQPSLTHSLISSVPPFL
jgi:hypothetical protein